MKRKYKITSIIDVVLISLLALFIIIRLILGSHMIVASSNTDIIESELLEDKNKEESIDNDKESKREEEFQDKKEISEESSSEETEEEKESQDKPKTDPDKEFKEDIVINVGQKLKIPDLENQIVYKSAKVVSSGISSSYSKQIALTFDAGWIYEPTVDLLNVLDEYNVKSTFFLRGYWVRDHKDLAKEIINRGHIIENHSLTHPHMREISEQEIREEIKETTRIIEDTTNRTPYLFRPPFGEYDDRVLKILGEEGYSYAVMWTIDTHDWAEEIRGNKVTIQYIIDRVLNSDSHKGIVLMHIGHQKTVEALPEVIEGLKSKGYTLTTANEMLKKANNTTIKDNIYTVEKGDSLSTIAEKYNTTVEEIIKLNNLE